MNKKTVLAGLLAVLTFCGCGDNKDSTDGPFTYPKTCLPDVADRYVFPVVQGSAQWNNMGTGEIISVCQLPEDVLKNISTAGLIRSFAEAAILLDYKTFSGAYDDDRVPAIFGLYSNLNCIPELLGRNNAGKELLRFFEELSFDCWKTMDAREQEYHTVCHAALTGLFMQPEILDQLNGTDRQSVVTLLQTHFGQMMNFKSDGLKESIHGNVTAYIMHSMLKNQYPPGSDGLIMTVGECLPDVAGKHEYRIPQFTDPMLYQIPDDELSEMSTFGLIRSFLDFPALTSQFLGSSNTSSIITLNRLFSRINCAQELIGRSDAGEALLQYYNAICFDCLKIIDPDADVTDPEILKIVGEMMTFSVQLAAVPVFLTQQEILDRLDKKKVVAFLLSKYGQMQRPYSVPSFRDHASLEVMDYIMLNDQYASYVENVDLNNFWNRYNKIIYFAINYIN